MIKNTSMNLSQSLLFFGIPGLLMVLGVYYLVPVLTQQGVPSIVSWPVLIWGPVIVLFAIVLDGVGMGRVRQMITVS